MKTNPRPAWRRYLLGVAIAVASVVPRVALNSVFGDRFPYTTAVIGVLAAAPLAGEGPAAMVALGGGAALYFLVSERDVPRFASFLLISALIIWVVAQLRRAHREASASAQLADQRLEQLRLETMQRAREERLSSQLRAVVESSEDAIISKDLSGIVQSWNYGAEQIFGYSAAEMQGQRLSLLIPADRVHEEADILERIRRGGRMKHFETIRTRKDGQQIHVSLTISPIRDAAGQVVGVSDIARDITEQRALEDQLRQTQRLESLGVLAGGLAHDFNNLLTGIVGNASLAMDDVINPAVLSRLTEILHAGERAAVLVRQMLAYAGKGRFVVEPLDLSGQVEAAVVLLRTSIPEHVQLDLRLAGDLPAVEADRSQMQQLILNLAMNAAEAVGDRPGTVTLATSARETDAEQQVVLEVADTGCGMDEATKARIFEPFFTTRFTGRGLGLAAVNGIVRAQKGSITVQTAPGRGSTFTVVLPAAAARAVFDPKEQPEIRGYGHLLVVDDEELTRNMARFTLERCGYTVQLANDGKAAVEAFAAAPGAFAAVLLDLATPVVSGEEALQRMLEIQPAVRVVLSTPYTETEACQKFHGHRLAGFLQKPYTATALARKIKQALKKE
ncbi:MAG TPA: PAS domain S-box protein [Bryobacteraceae bacterium]|nr:PAS domain S-box protein [Bryobacteraceae bacterium]